jgi:dipeptidyl aminopeptidase/acylaminoacyl peptidase
MSKLITIIILSIFVLPLTVSASSTDGLRAAFIRNDQLWIKYGAKERKLTTGDFVRYPKWSNDGKWIAYLKGTNEDDFKIYKGELWLYEVKHNKHIKVNTNVNYDFQWSPHSNQLGFTKDKSLYLFDFQPKDKHIASNIENFSWLPNGNGFLISSKESEELDSDIILSNVILLGQNKRPSIHPFYTVPVSKEEYLVSTSTFKWSHDHKWISFLLVPTASLSADSNILCILSHDGKVFRRLDEMLNYEDWFKWAPSKNILGYISGVGREATSNKQLNILHDPFINKKNYTPKDYVDRDLAFQNNHILFVSRSIASTEGYLDERPLPALYKINLAVNKQIKLTTSSKNIGDFQPQAIHNKLVWIRTDRKTANVLFSPTRIVNAQHWIKNIDIGSSYYERWGWEEVFSLYQGDNINGVVIN